MNANRAAEQTIFCMIVALIIGFLLPVPVAHADDFSLYAPLINTTEAREIAFVSGHIIHTMNEDGSSIAPLLPDYTGYDPDYSPDGEKIAYGGGLYSIMVMNADGSGATSLGAAAAIEDLIGADFVEVARPDWSPDGAKIVIDAMDATDYMPDLFVMNQDGTAMRQLTNTPDEQEFEPQWLPDGEHISYWRNCDIYVIDVDGADQVNLTNSPGVCEDGAVWSPDGQRIAFSVEYWPERSRSHLRTQRPRSPSIDPRDGIYLMNADGTGRSKLTNMVNIEVKHPAWSSDGEQIAFHGTLIDDPDYSRHIFVMDADGSNSRPLTNMEEAGDHFSPTWRP